jgi:hypothetical protein
MLEQGIKILPGTGRGTIRRMVEEASCQTQPPLRQRLRADTSPRAGRIA